MKPPVTIIGAGLSGSEAALQLSRRGIPVELWEQRPAVMTAAHTTGGFAELVCSNSLKSTDPTRASGLLKEELRTLGARLPVIAADHSVPGGSALCVDRDLFSQAVTAEVEGSPLVTIRREPFTDLLTLSADPRRVVVVASGPLTADLLWQQLSELVGSTGSYFYDATAPIITAGGINREIAFAQSRYDKGDGADYLNCPLDEAEYQAFRAALISSEQYPLSPGDEYKLYEGCLPIEELARRGDDTMRFGPLKPKGLCDPRTGREPHAVVQLRWEDALQHSLSLVGFQTRLKHGEQERIFRLIPGLEGAVFSRFGRMHRNSYLDAPRVLEATLALKARPNVLITGQLTGLEGYIAALATGLWAGVNAARLHRGQPLLVPHEHSCLGAMLRFMTSAAHKHYRPTAFQFGMLTWLPEKVRRQQKQKLIGDNAVAAWNIMHDWLVE